MKVIKIKDKQFSTFISSAEIQKVVSKVAVRINADLKGKTPLFIVILNGSFMFAADLLKEIEMDCETSFVKLASYVGTKTSSEVKQLIGLNEDISGRTVIIVEDIIDTGITVECMLEQLAWRKPAEVKIATLLFKPNAFIKDFDIDYIGMEIPNDFIIGYGLDYDGFGRNLPDIYKIVE